MNETAYKAAPERGLYWGAHVTMEHEGRMLLGEVTDSRLDVIHNIVLLRVRHFNGESWPVFPSLADVKLLDRTKGSE